MSQSDVEREIDRSRERLAQLRERAEKEGLGSESAIHAVVEELDQALEELSVTLEELSSANEELVELQFAAEMHARRYLDLFRFAPDAYVITDARGVIEEVNAAAEQQFARPRRYLMGKPLLPLVATPDRDAFLACLSRLREERSRIDGQVLRFGSDPGFDASVSAAPELREQGLEIRWTLRDVTQRRAAERQVRETAARIHAVLDAAQDAIVQIDLQGTIQMLNPAACRTFGYEARELLGQNVSMLMPSPHRERHGEYLERYRRTGEAGIIGVGRELEGLRKDGSRVPVHLSVGVAPSSGPPESYVGVIRDLSRENSLRRRLRSAAMAAAEAEERERRRLAVDLHDDVGQLLTLAGMRLGLLSDAAREAGLEAPLREVRELVARAHQHTDSLGFQLSPAILHDVGIAAATEWLAEELGRAYGLRVRVESDGEPPLSRAERLAVFRALRELLINVARHAGTDHASVAMVRQGGALSVSVEDRGVGFDLEERAGGFGLMSVSERIEGLGGRFEMWSEKGRGTRARMEIPLDAGAAR